VFPMPMSTTPWRPWIWWHCFWRVPISIQAGGWRRQNLLFYCLMIAHKACLAVSTKYLTRTLVLFLKTAHLVSEFLFLLSFFLSFFFPQTSIPPSALFFSFLHDRTETHISCKSIFFSVLFFLPLRRTLDQIHPHT
jgi:hypothetical protein